MTPKEKDQNIRMYHKYAIILFLALIVHVNGHGRLMKPPNRSSIWRIPEFSSQTPPRNYNDNELFCGGIHQAEVVGGNCGVCGDRYSQAVPRDNEIGGRFYRGIITASYSAGSTIDVEVELTQGHKGYMEWRLCTTPSSAGTQSCFNRYVLQRADNGQTKLPATGSGWYRTQLKLPAGVSCQHCVIQWNYRAGNNWGQCSDGSFATGCGPQETFRGCADVSIN